MAEAEESRKNIHPLIYRVYRQTVQRVNVSIKNLNSHAAFLIVVEEDKQVIAWIGSQCDADDTELANNIGETILRKDFREMDEEEIPNIVEGSEPSELLEVVLDVFWSNVGVYFSKASAKDRRKPLTNSSVSVGLLEPVSWAADVYDFQETAFAHPDSHGTVPRVSFVPIEMETVAYVNIGDHWDVWFARAVPEKEIEKVMEFIRNTVANQLSLADNTFTRQNDVLAQYIFMVRQGEEGTLFRRPLKIFTDYEPPGKCAPRPEPAPRVKKGKVKAKTPSITSADAEPAVDLGGSAGADKGPLEDKAKKSLTIDPNLPPDAPDSTSAGAAPANFWAPVKNETNPNDVVLGAPPAFGNSVVQLGETGVLSNETVEIDDKDGLFGLDVDIITPGMLKVVETENENPEKRQATIDRSVTDPKHLIGYQVEIDDGVYAGVFVVTQVKKNLFKKTLFHLTALDRDEFWIRLKRNKKSGTPFRPLRRVIDVQFIEKSKEEAAGVPPPPPPAYEEADDPPSRPTSLPAPLVNEDSEFYADGDAADVGDGNNSSSAAKEAAAAAARGDGSGVPDPSAYQEELEGVLAQQQVARESQFQDEYSVELNEYSQ